MDKRFTKVIRVLALCMPASLFLYLGSARAMEVPIEDFPILAYSQNTEDYIPEKSENYTSSLLSRNYQQAQFLRFYNHYYETNAKGMSPWSETLVTSFLPIIPTIEFKILDDFNNKDKAPLKKHYGENFKEHDSKWWNKINNNIDWMALGAVNYLEENRAIAIANTYARTLPDMSPDFYHPTIAGQGAPFDNSQESAIWVGTPLYVLSTTKDKAWALVLTPDAYFAWVKATDIAHVSTEFINQWQQAARLRLLAITKTETSIVNSNQQFQFTGYIGAVFPKAPEAADIQGQISILIPVKKDNNQAKIKIAYVSLASISIMPLKASPENMVAILNQLKNRPYGWGGAYFYNDCSQEMKSLFTPFGLWLPRNSFQQSLMGKGLDISASKLNERLELLKEKGHPLMTIVYLGGHIMLYLGNKNMAGEKNVAISYQNIWGLPSEKGDRRYVIGQSIFFPLLKSYVEQPNARPNADSKFFKLIFLDALPETDSAPSLINRYLLK